MSNLIAYRLEPWVDLADALGSSHLVSVQIMPDGGLVGLLVDPPFDVRVSDYGMASLRLPARQANLNYSVLQIHDWGTHKTNIEAQRSDYHYAQPLPDGGWLLVAARNRHDGRNGHLFSDEGRHLLRFPLGDAINDVQATETGYVWASYYDEASANRERGLVKWGLHGENLYQYTERFILDCYALNVTFQNEVWFYYYTDFQLVHLVDDHAVNYWDVPVKGSHAFAVWRHLSLFQGGYDNRDEYFLFEFADDHKMVETARYSFLNENEQVIQPSAVIMRDSLVVLLEGTEVYRVYLYQLQ